MKPSPVTLELIECVKPHDILYNNSKMVKHFAQRQTLWKEIAAKMNAKFPQNQHHAESWKIKWRDLRNYYANFLKSQKEDEPTETPLSRELHFLRPFMISVQIGEPATTKESQNGIDADDDDDDVVFVDEDMRYEITIVEEEEEEDDDDDDGADDIVGTTNESLEVHVTDLSPTANRILPDSIGEDNDRAFSNLIVDELRKMTPATQKEFKRHVTQYLYS